VLLTSSGKALENQAIATGEAPFYIPATGAASRPRLTLKHNDTFAVFDSHGDIGATAGTPDGLFDCDTRFLTSFLSFSCKCLPAHLLSFDTHTNAPGGVGRPTLILNRIAPTNRSLFYALSQRAKTILNVFNRLRTLYTNRQFKNLSISFILLSLRTLAKTMGGVSLQPAKFRPSPPLCTRPRLYSSPALEYLP
jgi:hypothetical protein